MNAAVSPVGSSMMKSVFEALYAAPRGLILKSISSVVRGEWNKDMPNVLCGRVFVFSVSNAKVATIV
jgi:hypothetical protein